MNADEVVSALQILCGAGGQSCTGNCAPCPANRFRENHPSGACDDGVMSASIAMIESLQAQLAEHDKEIERIHRFKEYFDELYGQGLEVANWHLNGNTEPFDSFYDSAVEYMNDPLPAAPEEVEHE